jgi:transposase
MLVSKMKRRVLRRTVGYSRHQDGNLSTLLIVEKITKMHSKHASQIKAFIGLDVHKDSVSVAIAFSDGSDPIHYGKWGGSNLCSERGLLKLMKKHGLTKPQLRIAYEAGPTGFVLARRLIQMGYDCIVVAPTAIPTKAGDKVKTDRRDASKVARLHRAGELRGIHIPDPVDEAVRDLCRARTDASEALAKSKQQLQMFLLRNGVRYPGKASWTQAHMNHLRRTRLADANQQIVLEECIMAVDAGVQRVKRLEAHLGKAVETWDRKPYVAALMAFRGFKIVAATTLIAELGDLSRFGHPRQLMAFLGLVPMEDSTGNRRRQGGITKTGNSHARWMLIECASHYAHRPKVTPQLSARQEGQSRPVLEISWKAQNRLHRRFCALAARRLHRNKVIVAMARELSAFIWELHQQIAREQASLGAAAPNPAKLKPA